MFIDDKQEEVPAEGGEMDADFGADEAGRAGDEEAHGERILDFEWRDEEEESAVL